jgi:citrate lyase subunit beta / citryl-CoA lyase
MNSLEKAYLFAPGNSEKKMLKALNIDTEAVIIDLEDAVVAKEKDKARQLVYSVLNNLELEDIKTKIYVRINSIKTPWFFDDMNLINRLPQLDGIMVPKSEDRTSITLAAELLNREIEILPLIESARGVNNIEDVLCSHHSVRKVAFGSVDFALDLGVDWSEDGMERTYAMSKLVLASRSLGLEPPIDAVFPVIDKKDSFISDTKKGKQLGFYGKMVIHPKQIEWVNEVYTPNANQVEWCTKVINVYETPNNEGAIDMDGKLIDRPVYLLAKRLIASK